MRYEVQKSPETCYTRGASLRAVFESPEAALTDHLSDDLRDAWERLRETAAELGDQRVRSRRRLTRVC